MGAPNQLSEQTRKNYWNRHTETGPFYPNLHKYNSAKRISLATAFIRGHRSHNPPDIRSTRTIWMPLFQLVLEGFTKEELVYAVEEAYRKRIKAYETTDKVIADYNLSADDCNLQQYFIPYVQDKITELIRDIEQGKDFRDLNKPTTEESKKLHERIEAALLQAREQKAAAKKAEDAKYTFKVSQDREHKEGAGLDTWLDKDEQKEGESQK